MSSRSSTKKYSARDPCGTFPPSTPSRCSTSGSGAISPRIRSAWYWTTASSRMRRRAASTSKCAPAHFDVVAARRRIRDDAVVQYHADRILGEIAPEPLVEHLDGVLGGNVPQGSRAEYFFVELREDIVEIERYV